jgi:hypothetical protein
MPQLGNKKYSYDKKGIQKYKADILKKSLLKGIKNLKIDSAINKERANQAIIDSTKQQFANGKYIKAINMLNQQLDSLKKNHKLQMTQIQKKHMIDSARNKNLPNRKQSGPASTPKRGGGEVK